MREHVARVFDEARRQSKPNIESGIARGRADAEIMNMPLRSETPGTALSEETRRDHEVTAIAKALGFLSSAIKSGEPWSEQCDAMKRAAFSALDSICLRTKEREEAASTPTRAATDAPGLPPDESPQRNAVCDALTEALLYIGERCGEACERTTVNLEDGGEVRELARIMTCRDADGLDGSLGENTRKLWERIGVALGSAPLTASLRVYGNILPGDAPRSLHVTPEQLAALFPSALPSSRALSEEERAAFAELWDETQHQSAKFLVRPYPMRALLHAFRREVLDRLTGAPK